MRTLSVSFLIAMWLCLHGASAASALTVVGDTNIVWNGGSPPTVTLSLFNEASSSVIVSDYQLELSILPAPESWEPQVDLLFDSACMPTIDYIFALSLLQPELTGLGSDSFTFTDIDFNFLFDPLSGTEIAPAQSVNLVSITFDSVQPSPGLYHVVLSPYSSDQASYYSGPDLFPLGAAFANAPSSNGNIIVASILVVGDTAMVPEPDGVVILIVGLMALCAYTKWCRFVSKRSREAPLHPTIEIGHAKRT